MEFNDGSAYTEKVEKKINQSISQSVKVINKMQGSNANENANGQKIAFVSSVLRSVMEKITTTNSFVK